MWTQAYAHGTSDCAVAFARPTKRRRVSSAGAEPPPKPPRSSAEQRCRRSRQRWRWLRSAAQHERFSSSPGQATGAGLCQGPGERRSRRCCGRAPTGGARSQAKVVTGSPAAPAARRAAPRQRLQDSVESSLASGAASRRPVKAMPGPFAARPTSASRRPLRSPSDTFVSAAAGTTTCQLKPAHCTVRWLGLAVVRPHAVA